MGSRKDYNEKLLAICQKVSSLTYSDLKTKYSTDFLNKIKDHKIEYGDFSVVDRLDLKKIDSVKKSKLKDVIKKLQDVEYMFNSEDIPNLNLFTSSIDSTVNHNQYISNIKNGTSNYLLGKTGIKYELEIDLLFNEIKKYDKLNDFLSNSTINPVFTTQGNFKSFLTVLFVICKNCQDIKYPLYYKYYQGILKWFYDIPRGDYDSFYDIYQQVDISDTPKAIAFDVYFHFLGIEIKNEIEIQNMANSIQDRNYLESEIFNYPDESFKFINNSTTDIKSKFRDWLTVNFTKSADKYFSYFNTANIISLKTELGDMYKWTEDEWPINESQLRENEDFKLKNTKGHNNLTASIAQFKKFLSMENEVSDIPIMPFDSFGWRWASTGIASHLNRPNSLRAVLDAILINGNGANNYTKEFKNLLYSICINKYSFTNDEAEALTKPSKFSKSNEPITIIENSANYWAHLGLLSTTGKNAEVSDVGKHFLTGELPENEFILTLIENYYLPNKAYENNEVSKWEEANLKIFPLKLIRNILLELHENYPEMEHYITEQDLSRIAIPCSYDLDKFNVKYITKNIIEFRKSPESYSSWPNPQSIYTGDKGFRMANEFLYFLEAFEFLKSNLAVARSTTGDKKYFATEKFQSLFSLSNGSLNKSNINYNIDMEMMKDYNDILTAIQTKPFILLAGISGTGKSRLVRLLAFNSCNNADLRGSNNKPGNYELIPVKPNWHDSSEIIGYVSRINGEKYVPTDFLKFIVKAWKYNETPFFLCLDEMNLAPVEQYFAEYLSIIETRSSKTGKIETDSLFSHESLNILNSQSINIYHELLKNLLVEEGSELWNQFVNYGIQIPPNLVVIGTVNMDETTHSFSRKVLDRAMTFEMNHVDLNDGLELKTNELSYPLESDCIPLNNIVGTLTTGAEVYGVFELSDNVIEYLEEINEILESSPFKIAYRVRDEFLIYCYYHHLKGGNIKDALDSLTSMKILSRIEGDENKTEKILNELKSLFESNEFIDKSLPKVEEMKKRLNYGYTSFWN